MAPTDTTASALLPEILPSSPTDMTESAPFPDLLRAAWTGAPAYRLAHRTEPSPHAHTSSPAADGRRGWRSTAPGCRRSPPRHLHAATDGAGRASAARRHGRR